MADPHYILEENPVYNEAIRALQDSDPARASTTFNPLLLEMLNNTHHVKKALDTAVCDLETKASDTDLVALGDAIEQVIAAHTGNGGIHVSLTEKAAWDAKETPTGAQEKANAVQASLSEHAADQSNPHAVNNEQLGAVPTSRKIAGKPLSTDVSLGALTFAGAVTGAYDGSEAKTITIPEGGGKRTVRFVVGTSTAGWTEKDCDYLCDGVADDVEINAAIQALPVGGGEILILDGTYNTANDIKLKDNVTLSGSGNCTKINGDYPMFAPNAIIIVKSYCTVKDLQIINSNKTNIYLSGSYFSITNNTLAAGITTYGCSDGLICNNVLGGVYLSSGASGKGENIVIANNVLRKGSIAFRGGNNIVIGNILKGDGGIHLESDYGFTGSVVVGNRIMNFTSYGIICYHSNCLIVGNMCIRGSGLPADYTDSQNTIKIYGSACLVADNLISGKNYINEGTGNTFVNNKYN